MKMEQLSQADLDGIREVRNDLGEAYRRLLSLYWVEFPSRLTALQTSLLTQNMEQASSIAKKMCEQSHALGAMSLGGMLRQISVDAPAGKLTDPSQHMQRVMSAYNALSNIWQSMGYRPDER